MPLNTETMAKITPIKMPLSHNMGLVITHCAGETVQRLFGATRI